ncbi:MAG: acyl--CoA ligase [Clostridiales bacterium]|nr:acyl--CoA ligase [Clostridiales bacterium]
MENKVQFHHDKVKTSNAYPMPEIPRPWMKYYPEGCIDKPLPEYTIYGYLKYMRSDIPDVPAIRYFSRRFNSIEFIEKIDLFASALSQSGIKKGDYVSIISVMIPETIFMFYALNKIGAVSNMIDPRTDTPHMKEYIDKASSKTLIVLENVWDKVKSILDGLNLIIVLSAGDSLDIVRRTALKLKAKLPKIPYNENRIIPCRKFIKRGKGHISAEVPYEKDYPCVVTRTGGTTGTSKGVVLTNDSLNASVRNLECAGMRLPGEAVLNFLPVAASYGVVAGIHLTFALGGESILVPLFKPNEFGDLVLKNKPNIVIGVPVFYENLVNNKRAEGQDLSYIRYMISGGDSANAGFEEKLNRFIAKRNIPYPLAQGYGMSETSSVVSFGARDIHKDGSAGIPGAYTSIAIFEPETENILPIGEKGEICITGPTLMKEYLDEPEETENILKLHADGFHWIHSGDIGYIDEDGFLFIEGRIKYSVIRFDGHKSYPVQLEQVVMKHPSVKSCCVIGVKDMDHDQGQLPLILAEPIASFTGDKNELRMELLILCSENIEERSQPADAVILDVLPLTGLGKIDVKKLTDEYEFFNYTK